MIIERGDQGAGLPEMKAVGEGLGKGAGSAEPTPGRRRHG